jgi:hypothetical protein
MRERHRYSHEIPEPDVNRFPGLKTATTKTMMMMMMKRRRRSDGTTRRRKKTKRSRLGRLPGC